MIKFVNIALLWKSCIFLQIIKASRGYNFTDLEFPDNFIFGVASASYQIEGAWNVSGKGENIWDYLTHTNPSATVNEDNGDVACNSYYKFKEDIQIIKELGFHMYRFSLSWSRIYPKGYPSGPLNEDGVRYYNEFIDELLSNGIEPMITIYHWDLPQPIQEDGGWLNSTIADTFAEYARTCFQLFGDRVKWWITINEPVMITRGYGKDDYAPMLNQHGTGEYISGHNILRAHAKAYRLYEKEFKSKQQGKLSIAFLGDFYFPKNESSATDIEAAERINQFQLGWFANPIFSELGDYPEVMKEYVKNASLAEGRNHSRLPTFTDSEINELKGSCDFFGLNHYSSKLATQGVEGDNPSINMDMQVVKLGDPKWLQSASPAMQVVPQGISGALRWIKDRYNNPEIFITENGYCGYNDSGIIDEDRVFFHIEYLKEVRRAMNNGSKVTGYVVWSILDNFEWKKGYSVRFGLVYVDFNNKDRPRTKKLSSSFFQELIQRNVKGISSSIKSLNVQ